jgi:hypothetical protein
MANVFRSKEVYKHLKYNLHDRNEIVAVQGVYVSGEYRPPYYNNPTIRIYTIDSSPAIVADLQVDESNASDVPTVGMYALDTTESVWDIERYSQENADIENVDTVGMYGINITDTIWDIDRYERDYIDTNTDTVGVYSLSVTDTTLVDYERYSTELKNNTPEPILRLSTLTSDKATVENYT